MPLTPEKPISPSPYLGAADAEDGHGFSAQRLYGAVQSLPLRQMYRNSQERHEDAVHGMNRINTTLGNNKPRLVPAIPSYQGPALPTPPAASPPRGTGAGTPPAPVQLGKRANRDRKLPLTPYEFGYKIASYKVVDFSPASEYGEAAGVGAGLGGAAGAGLGALWGAVSPGETSPGKKRGRISGALRGAGAGGLVGAGIGGLAGAGAYYDAGRRFKEQDAQVSALEKLTGGSGAPQTRQLGDGSDWQTTWAKNWQDGAKGLVRDAAADLEALKKTDLSPLKEFAGNKLEEAQRAVHEFTAPKKKNWWE